MAVPTRDLVVVGASAGGVEALRDLVAALPDTLRSTILIVLHVSATARSVLPEILQRHTKLAVRHAVHGERLQPGTILVAPPDHHLLVHGPRVRLSHGARENGYRPAVDPLFRSAARWFGPRAVGVILSGALDDGASGTLAIKMRDGVTLAQSPVEAGVPSMPLAAIEQVGVTHVGTTAEIAEHITRLSLEEVDVTVVSLSSSPSLTEASIEDDDMAPIPEVHPEGPSSSFTCPECHGALWELKDGDLVRFRCRVGHAFAPDSLLAYQTEHVEEAMWTALRALEETVGLARQLAERARKGNLTDLAARYDQRRADAEARALTIRKALEMFSARSA